jgi:hypothetical protein
VDARAFAGVPRYASSTLHLAHLDVKKEFFLKIGR